MIQAMNTTTVFGRDTMIASEVLVQAHPAHGLVDLEEMRIVSPPAQRMFNLVGEHVWLGVRSTLLPNAGVGSGSIIGAGAVVSGQVPPTCVAAGSPARVVRERASWSRDPARIAPDELAFAASLPRPVQD